MLANERASSVSGITVYISSNRFTSNHTWTYCPILIPKTSKKIVTVLPLVSVVEIVSVASAVVAVNSPKNCKNRPSNFSIVILHNILGLLFGFLLAKSFKLDFSDQKAIFIEVGMQNSGLCAALTIAHFPPISAVPSAIFNVWHNTSGPLLKNARGDSTLPSETTKQA